MNEYELTHPTKGKLSQSEIVALFDKKDYVIDSLPTKEHFEARVTEQGTIKLDNTELLPFKQIYKYEPKPIK